MVLESNEMKEEWWEERRDTGPFFVIQRDHVFSCLSLLWEEKEDEKKSSHSCHMKKMRRTGGRNREEKGKHGQKKDRQWNERMNRQELLRILLWEWKDRNDDDVEKQNEVTDACPRPSNLTSYEKRWEGGEKNVLWGSTSVLNIIRVGKRTLDNFEETRITCSKKYMDKKKVTTKTRHATLQN